MACFDRGAITQKPQLWFDSDVTVRYKGVRAGVVKRARGGDYYVCLLSMEWDGQSFLQQCSRSDSIDQGADVVAHRFWLLNETPEVT